MDDVGAILEFRQQLRNQRRRMLQVAVHHDDRICVGVVHAGQQRHLMPKPRGERQHLKRRVAGGNPLEDGQRRVLAAIDDKHDARAIPALEAAQHARQLRVEDLDHRLFVVDGTHDRERFHGSRTSSRRRRFNVGTTVSAGLSPRIARRRATLP